jgi:glutamine synthetase
MSSIEHGSKFGLNLDELSSDFDTVIVAAPDSYGRLFGRRLNVENFRQAIAEGGINVSTCVYGWDIQQDSTLLANGGLAYTSMQSGMGDFSLEPDLPTLRPAGWLDRTAICLARSVEADGEQTRVAPRTILAKELERWAELGLSAATGTELEFFLYRGSPRAARQSEYRGLEPTTQSPADYSLYEGDEFEPFFADLRERFERTGLRLEASQVEWGLGQWETTLQYGEPMDMADRHALYKLGTRSLAARNDLSATFMAKPFDGGPGSSCHVHVSVRDAAGTPIFWDAKHSGSSDQLRWAVGGILEHAPAFMAWYAPTVNSYRRTRGKDAAGWGRTWGNDHRFATVRVIGRSPGSIRLEFRQPGADANPYLVLAATLASVRLGLMDRTEPGPPIDGSPFILDPFEFPQSLGAAVNSLRESEVAREAFGDDVVDHYATLLGQEWSVFLDSVTDWERTRYFELI